MNQAKKREGRKSRRDPSPHHFPGKRRERKFRKAGDLGKGRDEFSRRWRGRGDRQLGKEKGRGMEKV
jgi:hypothetical protein